MSADTGRAFRSQSRGPRSTRHGREMGADAAAADADSAVVGHGEPFLSWRAGRPGRARAVSHRNGHEGRSAQCPRRGRTNAGESWRRAEGAAAEGIRRAACPLRKAVPAVGREMVSGDRPGQASGHAACAMSVAIRSPARRDRRTTRSHSAACCRNCRQAKWRPSVAAARVADRATLLVVACALLLAYAPRSHALDPAYLKEWPSADQVLADHQGKDRQDTLARQMAALHHLDRSIEDMAGARRWHGLTPDENRLRGEYYAAAERIRDEVNSTLSNELPPGFNGPFAKPPLRKWYALQWKYERDPQVRDRTLGRYLSPPLLAELGAKKSASDARAGEAGRELLDGLGQPERGAGKSYLVPLVALAALGLLVVVIRSRRRHAASRETASHAESRDGSAPGCRGGSRGGDGFPRALPRDRQGRSRADSARAFVRSVRHGLRAGVLQGRLRRDFRHGGSRQGRTVCAYSSSSRRAAAWRAGRWEGAG